MSSKTIIQIFDMGFKNTITYITYNAITLYFQVKECSKTSFEEALLLTIIGLFILGQGLLRGFMNQEIVRRDHQLTNPCIIRVY